MSLLRDARRARDKEDYSNLQDLDEEPAASFGMLIERGEEYLQLWIGGRKRMAESFRLERRKLGVYSFEIQQFSKKETGTGRFTEDFPRLEFKRAAY